MKQGVIHVHVAEKQTNKHVDCKYRSDSQHTLSLSTCAHRILRFWPLAPSKLSEFICALIYYSYLIHVVDTSMENIMWIP